MMKLILLLVIIFPLGIYGQTYLGNFGAIQEIEPLGDRMFFTANGDLHGSELWVTNGTEMGTSMVKDIAPGSWGSNPSNLISYKGNIYFTANDKINGTELWKSDGTAEGTKMVMDINPTGGSGPSQLTLFNDELYFTASDNSSKADLWKTDGTNSGTKKVFEVSYRGINDLTVVGNDLFFIRGYKLVKLDGNTNEVQKIEVDDYYFLSELNSFNNSLFFITYTTNRQEIRFYNYNSGTTDLTLLKEFVQPKYGDQDIDNFTEVNGTVFFSVRTDYNNDPEQDVLWKTDGTKEGTVPVKSFGWDRHWSNSYMQNFISYNNLLYFRGSSAVKNYLYKSDGTAAGTELVYAIALDEYVEPIVSNGKIYFGAEGLKLWETDGTSEGTKKFSDIKLNTYTDPTILYNNTNKDVIYFKGSDEYGLALYNNIPNSEIEIKNGYREIANGGSIDFESKVDSCSSQIIRISNEGNKELSISKVLVTGVDFSLKGEVDQFIHPGESSQFDLIYFPHSEGTSNHLLEIHSNDENEGVFKVNISGISSGVASTYPSDSLIFNKELVPFKKENTGQIKLDNRTIVENAGENTTVGLLSLEQDNNSTFSLVAGEGDRDNLLFRIDGKKLIASESFDYELINSFNIRIEAVTHEGVVRQQPFVIDVINLNEEAEFSKCKEKITNLAYALTDVEFLDENTLIAIGASGAILKSINSGQNWYQLNSGTNERLCDVQFVDDKVGYITGYSGLLLKTENAGEDWFPIQLPKQEYPYPTQICFINQNIGYILGGNGKFLKTTDGGLSWQTTRGGSYDFSAASFINENLGFMCGRSNILIKTEDGGNSWTKIDLKDLGWNISFIDIQFVSEKIGFMAGGKGEIYKTTDCGVTWTKVGEFRTDHASDIFFIDESVGYAIGGWSSTAIYKTVDGGVTWFIHQESIYNRTIISLGFSPDGNKGCAVGYGSSLGSTGEDGRTIMVMNNDKWSLHSSLQEADFNSVSYLNDTTAIIFGQKDFKTTDSGISWNEINIENSKGIIDSYFINDDIGFVIDRYNILKTIDGGSTWVKVENGITDVKSLKDIYFFNENFGFISGWSNDGNVIYRTTDGGSQWEKIENIGTTRAFEDMCFLDLNHGFAVVGNSAEILETDDGGLTWKSLNNFYLKWLLTINFLDENTGVALGHDGFELRTVDGGKTWEEINTGVGRDFMEAYFIDSHTGYALCDRGIYKTNDGGLSWKLLSYLDDSRDFAINNGNLLIVGKRGLVYSITDLTPPTLPGYISGLNTVPANTLCNYSVPLSSGAYYSWEVEGDNSISYSKNEANIRWGDPGVYTVKVKPYNSCGLGKIRELSVLVEGIPNPEIIGDDTASARSFKSYQAQNHTSGRLKWSVTGGQIYQTNDNSIDIVWGEPGTGKIELLETKIESGARGKAVMNVHVLDTEDINSSYIDTLLKRSSIFPNPSADFINIDFNNLQQEPTTIIIRGVNGGVYKERHFTQYEDIQIDVRDLPSGLYILELVIGNKSGKYKVIKQ